VREDIRPRHAPPVRLGASDAPQKPAHHPGDEMTNTTNGPASEAPRPAGTAPAPDTEPRAPEAAKADEAAPAGAGEPKLDAAQLEAIVRALQDEVAAAADQNLRLRAEMENMRKRFERERADTQKFAISKFAQDVVNVGDNFQRAIAAVPAHAAEQDPALNSFLDGVLLAEREFIKALERHGVVRLDPKGEPFNPKVHNAVMEQENREVPAGTVLQVFQAGYMIDERCLKPALVVVSRGGPKAVKMETQPNTDAAPAPNGQSGTAAEGGTEPHKA
jgi:molecular chaperone GrpE